MTDEDFYGPGEANPNDCRCCPHLAPGSCNDLSAPRVVAALYFLLFAIAAHERGLASVAGVL